MLDPHNFFFNFLYFSVDNGLALFDELAFLTLFGELERFEELVRFALFTVDAFLPLFGEAERLGEADLLDELDLFALFTVEAFLALFGEALRVADLERLTERERPGAAYLTRIFPPLNLSGNCGWYAAAAGTRFFRAPYLLLE